MGIIKFYFHPIFIIFSFCMIYFGMWQIYLTYILALILHELSHLLVARLLHHNLTNVLFMPYGVSIDARGEYISPSHEVAIALAGPVCNILIVMISVCIWWMYPSMYAYTKNFVDVNIVLALFNLLPILPLDGGRALVNVFFNSSAKVKRVMNIICIILVILFAGLFLYSLTRTANPTYLFVACFLASSILSEGNEKYYSRANRLTERGNIPREERTIIVPYDTPEYTLYKYIDSSVYTVFKFLDSSGKVVKIKSTDELLSKFTK